MVSAVLVDTDILVDHLRGEERARIFLKKIENNEIEAHYSTITEAELYAGRNMDSKEVRARVGALLGLMKRVQVKSHIARKAGEIKRHNNILLPDAIIAASAMTSKAGLATRNTKHFKGIEGLEIATPAEAAEMIERNGVKG